MADYRKGQPSIAPGEQQLPQGGASQANAGVPQPAAPMDIPVIYATPGDAPQPRPDGANEDLDILTAPPNPAYTPPLVPKASPQQVPSSVVRNLPRLMAAAKDPEAPESVKALYRGIVWELERQRPR